MKRLLPVLLVGVVALAQEKASYTVSDIVLLGLGERHVVFYDDTNTFKRKLEGNVAGRSQTLEIQGANQNTQGFQINGALEVNGNGSWQLPVSSNLAAFSAKRTGERMTVKANTDLRSVYLWDGKSWFTVLEKLKAGEQLNTLPMPRDGLLGAGNLWKDEATSLETYLQSRGAFLIATLPDSSLDGNETSFDPIPSNTRRSVLAVQFGYEGMWLQQDAPAPLNPVLDVTAVGAFSTHRDNNFWARVDSTTDDYARTWQIAMGGQTPMPPVPKIDFFNRRMLTVFLGKKPTTGYGLAYKSANFDRGTLRVTLELREPTDNNFSNTPTSPFIMLEVAAQTISSVQVELVRP
jgi:hypothetical protein